MTRLFVDEREFPLPPPASSLEQILKHVEDTVLQKNSVIKQIRLDGLPLVPEDFINDPSPLLQGVGQRERIDILTATVWEIAKDSIREAICYLDRVEAAAPSLASSFQVSPGPEAFDNLKQLYEGFYWLNMLIDRLEIAFKISLSSVTVEGASAQEHCRKFLSVLRQLVEAHEREDFILMADLLEYEVIPLVPLWKSMFAILGERVTCER